MTSSDTFNVGAPTFGVREQRSRFCGVSYSTAFPFWNDGITHSSMPLKTNSFHKPSSNTFNVGAPTFFEQTCLKEPFVVADLKAGPHIRPGSARPAVSR
jgi:hypothetical protein